MPSKTWGTSQVIKDYLVVSDQDEIPSGHKAYVFSQQQQSVQDVAKSDWEEFMNGNLSDLKNKIETEIPHTKVIWLNVSWTKAHLYGGAGGGFWYAVEGFYIEAMVENTGEASLTGLEIVAIIMAIAFFAVVLNYIFLTDWIAWEVMESVPDIGKPFVGIILLIGIALFLLILFGAKVGVSKEGATIGK